MMIPASSELAQGFIYEILGLSLKGEIDWHESVSPPKKREAVRVGSGLEARYFEVEARIHTLFDDYWINLYRVSHDEKDSLSRREGHVMHISSSRHKKKRFVGGVDAESNNQDLVTIFRKVTDPGFPPMPTAEPDPVSQMALKKSLDRFFEVY